MPPPRAPSPAPAGGVQRIGRLLSGMFSPGGDPDAPHPRGARERWVPEEEARWLESWLFRYVDPLVALGWRLAQRGEGMELDDLWDVAEGSEAEGLAEQFDAALRRSRERRPGPQGSLGRALLACHAGVLLKTAAVKVVHDVLNFSFPVLLRWMLQHLQGGGSRAWAVFIAVVMLVTLVCKTLAINLYFNDLFRLGARVKAQLVHALYKKALRISESAKARHGVGGIVNLQSNDASKLWDLPKYMHILWSGPLQIAIAMVLLATVVGPVPAATALVVTMLLVPLSTGVGKLLMPIRKRLIAATDARVKASTEVVTGIKAIKLYAWEEPYTKRIEDRRAEELAHMRRLKLTDIVNRILFNAAPVITTMVTFVVYTKMGYPLTPDVAFPALALFGMLRFPVSVLPRQIMQLVNASVALKRLQDFMDAEEVGDRSLTRRAPLDPQLAIQVVGGSFSWGSSDGGVAASEPAAVLYNVDLPVARGHLTVVVGEVGAGKSSLLQAILGELCTLEGSVYMEPGASVAYTAQDTWIQNATVRDNILMGRPFDSDRYHMAVRATALGPDLEVLTAGDETEIGEKGVNLSGGQKQRVALARAVYADADIYLLDDPLSAVDAHVQAHLMRECIGGALRGKTRVLVTHQVQHAQRADRVVVVEGGRVTHVGTCAALRELGVSLSAFCDAPSGEPGGRGGESETSDAGDQGRESAASTDGDGEADGGEAGAIAGPAASASMPRPVTAPTEVSGSRGDAKGYGSRKGKLVQKEIRQIGQVKLGYYKTYLGAWGTAYTVPLLALGASLLTQVLLQVTNWWLKDWSVRVQVAEEEAGEPPEDNPLDTPSEDAGDLAVNSFFYLSVYNVLSVLAIVATASRSLLVTLGSLTASRRLHDSLLGVVMRLPMSFFESQPAGRLLNRFTRDLDKVDMELAGDFDSLGNFPMQLVANMVMVALVSPPVAMIFILLSTVYVRTLKVYVATSREVKRIDSVQNSPIFSHFQETVHGLVTLRAFGAGEAQERKNTHLVDLSTRAYWPSTVLNRWLSTQLEMLGNVVIFATAVMTCAVAGRGESGAGMAGLALSSAVSLTGLLNWVVRCVSDVEVDMNSVERICEYMEFETEAPAVIPGERPAGSWPENGVVEARDLMVRYREDLEPAIRGVSFATRAREKVGLVGRTGCGKSTLMMAVFRIIEPSGGTVLIDGVDVSKIGLFDLRSKLALVPQDPVVFSGSVRSNLDPFGAVRDEQAVWEALDRVHLSAVVRAMGGLDATISEGGGNLSVGQRQLLCMARALLRDSRILLLDEATSNVDNATDAVIQRTIRDAFRGCTVLTIAHRLNTIMDYDRILVLDAGRVLEYDPPRVLLSRAGSAFASLVGETGGAR